MLFPNTVNKIKVFPFLQNMGSVSKMCLKFMAGSICNIPRKKLMDKMPIPQKNEIFQTWISLHMYFLPEGGFKSVQAANSS